MFPNFLATDRYELLEIQIAANSTSTRFNIPDQPQLRSDQDADIAVQAIEAFEILDVPLSPNAVALVSLANLQATYLTLYNDGEESLYRIPLIQLHRIRSSATASFYSNTLQKLRNKQIDWTKSYFFTPSPYGSGTFATFSFLLGVHYMKLPPGTLQRVTVYEENQYLTLGQ
jgi:hypothetical protein